MFRSALITTALLAAPAYAQDAPSGDAAAGESVFNQCQACHVVENGDGEVLAGRNGKVGPNLYGISGRTLGSVEDFRYSKSLVAAGEEAGLEWNEENFVGYVQDPTGWLKEKLDDNRARGNMAYKLRSEEDAANVWAYIVSLDPEAGS
ncbi:c-type cytochrome [Roseovarius nanhaiticus]|uniref:c-type cytochrome n=1 Tax=Roseovarius nanhaiticus TaxID=573024 RepID=UPI00249015FE|nr:c-type cytochrome [Roseovarius nanhaiticus]